MVRLPGRESRLREEAFSSMLPLVQGLARHFPEGDAETGAKSGGRPFAFFGHSLGARLSFELTLTLRRQLKPLPVHLLVSACSAPQLRLSTRPIHALPKTAFLAELEQRNGTPAAVFAHPELMDLLLPMLRADFTVYETAVYRSEAPLPLPISAFGGREDPLVSSAALEAWSEQTTETFEVTYFAGDHFFLRTAEKELLPAIGRLLS